MWNADRSVWREKKPDYLEFVGDPLHVQLVVDPNSTLDSVSVKELMNFTLPAHREDYRPSN